MVQEMKLSNWKSLALLSALTLSLATCNTGEVKEKKEEKPAEQVMAQQRKEETEDHNEHEHEEASNLRFVVSTTDGVKVFDEK